MEIDPGLDLENAIRKEEHLTELEKAIEKLSAEQKTCIQLFYLQDKSYKEVVDITGFTMKQVKSYIQNGKRKLRGYLID